MSQPLASFLLRTYCWRQGWVGSHNRVSVWTNWSQRRSLEHHGSDLLTCCCVIRLAKFQPSVQNQIKKAVLIKINKTTGLHYDARSVSQLNKVIDRHTMGQSPVAADDVDSTILIIRFHILWWFVLSSRLQRFKAKRRPDIFRLVPSAPYSIVVRSFDTKWARLITQERFH